MGGWEEQEEEEERDGRWEGGEEKLSEMKMGKLQRRRSAFCNCGRAALEKGSWNRE